MWVAKIMLSPLDNYPWEKRLSFPYPCGFILCHKKKLTSSFTSDEPNDGINKMLIENWDKNLLDIASKID